MDPNKRLLSVEAASRAMYAAGEFLIENPDRYDFISNTIPEADHFEEQACLMGWALFFAKAEGYVREHHSGLLRENTMVFGFTWDDLIDAYAKHCGRELDHEDVQCAPNILQWGAKNIEALRKSATY